MKLLALTYGTEGDTRPIAALCSALMAADHEVSLLAEPSTLGSARALGVPCAALSGNMQEELHGVIAAGKGINATITALSGIANVQAESWMQQAAQAAADCDAIIVAGLTAFVGMSVAERLHLPLIGAGMIPISPTSEFPSPFLPTSSLPRPLNKASHHLVNWLLWVSFRKSINRARRGALNLPPRHRLWSGHPMLYGISPAVLPTPPDWPDNATLCGQWLTPAAAWSPPPELEQSLAVGEPPIYLGFGSMVGFDREALLLTLLDALKGARVVFNPGWSGLPAVSLPEEFLVIGDTPHDWLFPRMSLAIHHGGSGTTDSACRAGIPSVVLPFAGDQFFWGHQLARLGVADAPLSSKHLHADAIRDAVRFARSAQACTQAAALAKAMSQEDALAVAVEKIEGVLAGQAFKH